jgi:hypothetical protein
MSQTHCCGSLARFRRSGVFAKTSPRHSHNATTRQSLARTFGTTGVRSGMYAIMPRGRGVSLQGFAVFTHVRTHCCITLLSVCFSACGLSDQHPVMPKSSCMMTIWSNDRNNFGFVMRYLVFVVHLSSIC